MTSLDTVSVPDFVAAADVRLAVAIYPLGTSRRYPRGVAMGRTDLKALRESVKGSLKKELARCVGIAWTNG